MIRLNEIAEEKLQQLLGTSAPLMQIIGELLTTDAGKRFVTTQPDGAATFSGVSVMLEVMRRGEAEAAVALCSLFEFVCAVRGVDLRKPPVEP